MKILIILVSHTYVYILPSAIDHFKNKVFFCKNNKKYTKLQKF